jgi:hypothetical protein
MPVVAMEKFAGCVSGEVSVDSESWICERRR